MDQGVNQVTQPRPLREVLREKSDQLGTQLAQGSVAHRISAERWEKWNVWLIIAGAVLAAAAGATGITSLLPSWAAALLSFAAAAATTVAASLGAPAKVAAHRATSARYNRLAHEASDFQTLLDMNGVSDQQILDEWHKLRGARNDAISEAATAHLSSVARAREWITNNVASRSSSNTSDDNPLPPPQAGG